ncbi:class II fructose-bisphosphate aldolase [Vannielia litorea]|uniref:Fructose-bisphosphate aldolase, class II n=1 Tax=Vannielia litorea TaxID=1217970 RepID=A0A1N6IFT7_9RHOB|nr:class II fructose-bisphosphate aldolase [Vannielia litorea]SIO30880.1 fructose-bisphosphate aldolase, class II [Vannielia litorea]
MPLVTLKDAMECLPGHRGALAGLVVLGWEDAQAYIAAAERVGCPAILQAGPGCRAHTPLTVLAEMFRVLAARARVPVVAHLDHGKSPEECLAAIEAGFSSVMYDGSALPLAENIENTGRVLEAARRAGVSVEAELGVVGYVGAAPSVGTDPEEARRFIAEVPVDALAISAGNTHLSTSDSVPVDIAAIRAVEAVVPTPLVLHGGSGIPRAQRRQLALETRVMKFNIGTELRQAFGGALRAFLEVNPTIFDRNAILGSIIEPVADATEETLKHLQA